MIDRLQLHVILHGAIVLLIGLSCGIPFGSVASRAGDEAARAWRVAHAGGAMLGVMLVAVAAVLPRLRLTDVLVSLLAWSLIVGAYAFTVGVVLAAVTGARGLTAGDSATDVVVHIAYVVGTLATLVAVGLTIAGAGAALAAPGRTSP